MQWTKAKTYLIIALLIANIVLFLSLDQRKIYFNNDISSKNLNNINQILSDMGVKNNLKLSNKKLEISPIEVKFANINSDNETDIFVDLNNKYKNEIKIIDDIYYELILKDAPSGFSNQKEFARTFIREIFPGSEYKLKDFSIEQDSNTLVYEEYFKGLYLGQGYVKFLFYEDGDVDISILKAKIISQGDKVAYAISQAQALSLAIPKLKRGDIITGMALGYDMVQNNPYEDDESKTERIRMIPYWRIQINSREFIYVEAIS